MSTPTEPPPPPPSDTEPGETQPVLVIAVCHTEGCRMNGTPLYAWVTPNPPDFPPVLAYWCGSCGTLATDVTEVPT